MLASELTDLSAVLWRCYTHPASSAASLEENSEGWRRQRERDSFSTVARNVANPNLPDEQGLLLVSYDPVVESAHRVGRALHAISDQQLRDAVVADVEAEVGAVEMAEGGDLTGRALQAVVLSRAGANPLHVSAAHAALLEDPIGGHRLLGAFDPTAASVAAAHWLKAAVDVVATVAEIDPAGVLSAADDLEALPLDSPSEVLELIEFSNTMYRVVVEMVGDAMLVAEGVVSDLDDLLIQRGLEDGGDPEDDDEPTATRLTLLDPSRPAPDLLEDLVSAIRGCRLLYEGYVHGEAADVDAQFCAAVRAEAEKSIDRLL